MSSTDENEFSTLVKVTQDFAEQLEMLHHFNAFEIGKDKLPASRAKILLHEVEVNQAVYAVLLPIFETLNSTVNDINQKYRERLNNG